MTEPLTSVELETLRLLADGLNTAEIAAKVYMSQAAIKDRVVRIRFKLGGAKTQAQAVAVAYRRGILVPDPDGSHVEDACVLAETLRRAGYRLTPISTGGAR